MAVKNSPAFACGQFWFNLKISKLHYVVKETPFSAYITIRKKFITNNNESQDTPADQLPSGKSEGIKQQERNFDLETRLALAKVEFEEMEIKKENLLCEISNNEDEIENSQKKERMLK
jgi:hypothetical protein